MVVNRIGRWGAMCCVAMLAAMSGCWGAWNAKDAPPSTAQFRVETEFVPDAQIVKEDVSPDWEQGRQAFIRGTDRVLVLTRYTSTVDIPMKDKQPEVRSDKFKERAWIQVPSDIPMGQEINVDELEKRFLLAYDNEERGKGMFVKPYRITGRMTLLEEKDGNMIAFLDVLVTPHRDLSPWRVKGTIPMPITRSGINARPAVNALLKQQGGTPSTGTGGASTSTSPSSAVPAPVPATPAAPGAPAAPATPAPTAKTTTPVKAADLAPSDAKSIVGRWAGDAGGYKYQFQFDNNTRFVFTSSKGGATGTRRGTYSLKGDYIVLHVEQYEVGGADKLKTMPSPFVMLRVDWAKEGPSLSGDLKSEEGRVQVPLKTADFAPIH